MATVKVAIMVVMVMEIVMVVNGVSGKNNNNKDNNKKRKKKGDDLRGFPHYASLYANNTVDSCERLYTSSLLPARYLILTNLN